MATIQGVKGNQYSRSSDPAQEQAYTDNNYQYATSTHQFDHDMNPALIVQPANDEDIILTLKYAKQNGLAVAVKSGGHQYSGASSTSGQNILIDMRKTFKDGSKDLVVLPRGPDGETFVYAAVSWGLGEFNAFLRGNGLFIPHGQCTDVHIGGHCQTGGYGQLGRSFGLIGDHVREIRLVNHNAEITTVDKGNDPEMFYAILGGSPGNFGIVTHYTLEVHRDEDYDFHASGGLSPHGMRAVWFYNENIVKKLLAKVAEMADDPEFPGNYDLCVSVLSRSFPLLDLIPDLDGVMKRDHPDIFGHDGQPFWPATVILYAQWVPFHKDEKYDPKWFSYFRDMELLNIACDEFDEPMSKMTGRWIFRNIREFNHPYVKRTWLTDSTTLTKDKWVDTVSDRIDMVVDPSPDHVLSLDPLFHQCWLSCQIQCFGGNKSKFRTNADNGTSYSWRDSSVVQVLDCFHESHFREVAEKWQSENDAIFSGPDSCFSKQDKRVLWGSYGEYDLDKAWQYYYEDRAKYTRIGKARSRADPDGTFTANPFAVKRA